MRRVLVAVALGATLTGVATAAPDRTGHSCVRGNELWFRAADGVRLVGHRFGGTRPGGKTAVVLAHQSDGDLCEWLRYARSLARGGYFAFPFDFRGYGFSRGRRTGTRMPGDVAAAVKAVRRLGAKKVVVVGASMGGVASLVAAANIRPPVDGVVALSAPAAYIGMDALKTARRLRVPVLYVAGRDEQRANYDFPRDARRMYEATASDDKRLEIVPGSLHGVELLERTPEVQRLVERFLKAR